MSYIAHADFIQRKEDNAIIPKDLSNRDYAEYVAWLNAGNEPELPPEAPVFVPQEVSRFQAIAALHVAGHLTAVEAYMADAGTDPIVKIAWKEAVIFKRTSPTVAALQAVLNLTGAELDALFVSAASIEA